MPYRTTSLVKLAVCTALAVLPALVAVPVRAASTASQEASMSRALVDTVRTNAGVRALDIDTRLERVARAQSERMAAQGSISHNAHLGQDASATGIDWRWLGENVGVGPDARLIHDGFMSSPHHHAVIVHADANRIGVGAVIGKDGRVYITQVYAKVLGTPQRAPVVTPAGTPRSPVARKLPPKAKVLAAQSDPNAVIDGVVERRLRSDRETTAR